ncbi:hypothetical protein ACH42_08885 [Endozoicomonas sp. (ex Bugula neritina AB1)]|nr:hypothetical protein ACH42_08885 [Endozoicomonas sp. (ex Bugula neritina AB1)]
MSSFTEQWGRWKCIARELTPKTLPGRFLLVMFGLMLTSQVLVNQLWENQTRQDMNNALRKVSTNLALRVSSTVEYFVTLPSEHRQVIVNRLRYMGGARYFITLNKEFIHITPFEYSAPHRTVITTFQTVLGETLSVAGKIQIAFANPETLNVIDNQSLLKDLPDNWGQESLLVEPLDIPILVIQVPVAQNEWIYLATLMPDSSILSQDALSGPFRPTYLFWMLALLAISSLIIHIMTRPFKKLSGAAKAFGYDLEPIPITEEGCMEYETTARAFNQMQKNIRHYINDRKQLFTGISHDLKTPITRLRLRAELLDKDSEREAFTQDLDHLEMMVKSALQTLSDTDIHENPETVDLRQLVNEITLAAQSVGQRAWLHNKEVFEVTGKPLALKRCLENLIGNAILYGEPANIYLNRTTSHIVVTIHDSGPGLPAGMEEEIFKPYLRLEHGRSQNPGGNGLGLVTARHLAQIHGGSLKLLNRTEGGLEVTLKLPIDRKSQ